MRPGLLLPRTGHDPAEVATRAEAAGYRSVWVGELWGPSAPVLLADVAGATTSIDVGSAILNVFSRSPAVLAATAVSLDRLAGGRMTLGLGTSTPKAVRDLHGLSFERPVRRARETVELVRRFTRGDDRVDYDGEVFSVSGFPGLDRDVPLYYAALGPANRRVVGRLCDGWLPHNIPFGELAAAFETVAAAAREAGREPDDVEVTPYVPTAVRDDPADARDAIRGHLAYYVGSGDGYRRAVGTRFPSEAERIASYWASGERDRARAEVTDEMVSALGVAGTPETVRDRFLALVDRPVVDHPVILHAGGFEPAAIELLAP